MELSNKIPAATLARTAVLLLALTNQVLSAMGKPVLPIESTTVEQLAAYAETCLPGTGGIGRYPPRAGRAVGWVHVDTRPAKSRWTG